MIKPATVKNRDPVMSNTRTKQTRREKRDTAISARFDAEQNAKRKAAEAIGVVDPNIDSRIIIVAGEDLSATNLVRLNLKLFESARHIGLVTRYYVPGSELEANQYGSDDGSDDKDTSDTDVERSAKRRKTVSETKEFQWTSVDVRDEEMEEAETLVKKYKKSGAIVITPNVSRLPVYGNTEILLGTSD
jgi:hypothetical protein